MTEFTITGQIDTKKAMSLVAKGAESGLRASAEAIMAEANKRVPLDQGPLMESGRVTESRDGEIAFGYNTPYAVRLHEHPEYNFKNGRQGKWLENAIQAMGQSTINKLAEAIRKELG